MAKQLLNTGAQPNDGSGDGLRTGGIKVNNNFNEIYSLLGDGDNLLNTDIDFGPNKLLFSNQVDTTAGLSDINVNSYEGIIVHVENTGALYYAHAGKWHKILSDNSNNNVTNYVDSLKSVAYTGNYNDLTNRPSVPTGLTDLSGIVDGSAGQALITDGTGNFTFRDIEASSIEFGNITNRPTSIAGYGIQDAFSGDYEDLTNKPTIFSGSFDDLTDKPTIPADVNQLTDNSGLLFDGTYVSLTGKPTIPADLSELTDTTEILFSGSYADLTSKPTSFSGLTALSMALGVNIDEFSNDGTLGDNSSTSLVTESAVKTYVDTKLLSAGIALDDLGVVVNSAGSANLTYNNSTGIFTYTPPDLSSYATTASLPTVLTDLGITDGTVGQVLTTDGDGTFTFQDPGDQIGNFTLASSVIDTDDSSAITITPAVIVNSDLTVENNLTVNNDVTILGNLSVESFTTSGTGAAVVEAGTNLELTAGNAVVVTSSPLRLASFTTSERDLLAAQNGDLIYNTTDNKLQGYQNGSWINIDGT